MHVQTIQQQNNELQITVKNHEDALLAAQKKLQAKQSLNVDHNSEIYNTDKKIDLRMQEYISFNDSENIRHKKTLKEHSGPVWSLAMFVKDEEKCFVSGSSGMVQTIDLIQHSFLL